MLQEEKVKLTVCIPSFCLGAEQEGKKKTFGEEVEQYK